MLYHKHRKLLILNRSALSLIFENVFEKEEDYKKQSEHFINESKKIEENFINLPDNGFFHLISSTLHVLIRHIF